MKININESGISFNRDSGSNNAVLDESILKEIEERLKNINDKVEYSDKIPTDEDIVIWINPDEDPAQEYLIRINDETIASNTVWSSEKVYQQINNMFIQADSHIHFNKDVLDKITERDIANWNSKSNFDGSYKSLTDKPTIPSVEGLASEEYVNEAIENLQLPSNLATKEDIPTNVSELENDSGFITKTELEDKNYLVYDDVTHFALKEEVPTKISELEDDKNIATVNDLHGHNNKTVIDGITSEQVAKWDSNTSFDGDYYSLKNRPNIPTHTSNLQNDSGFITEIPNEYITEAELEDTINTIEKIVSSDIQPTDDYVTLWVNTAEDNEYTPVAKIDDATVASNTTWSSEKINSLNKVIFMPISRDVVSGAAAGDCSCIITDRNKVILIDTGASHSYNLIKTELKNNNVKKIDYLIISHYHADHCQNLNNLKNDFDMSDTIYYLCKHTNSFVYYDDYVISSIGDNIKIYPNNNDVLNVDDLVFTFVNCSQDDIDYYDTNSTNYNDYSMCCYCENERFSIFFSGDISTKAQGRLMELDLIKKVNVLKVEHHGADITVNHDYLKVLNPEYSVISDSELKYIKENILCESVRIQNSMGTKVYCAGKETIKYSFNNLNSHINGIYPINTVFKDMRTYNLIYLDKDYTGISDGSYHKPFRSLREAIALAYTLMPCCVQILTKDGSIFETDEHIRIVNFYSNLKLDNMKIRQLNILNSNVSLGTIEISDEDSRILYIDQSNVTITSLTVNGDVRNVSSEIEGRGVAIYNSKVHATNMTINNKRIALCVYNCSDVFISSFMGENNEYGSVCAGNSTIGTNSYNIECEYKVYPGDKTTKYLGGFTNDLTAYLNKEDDLNNFKTINTRYVSKTGEITQSLLNAPNGIGYSMVLTIEKQTEDGSLMQTIKSRHFTGTSETGIWCRTYNSTDKWSNWFKLI